ncbi:MAG: hypothetical protein C4526_00825 [Nitrospiraceae bacterium]|nr:MAG: hypothetical protein C4526_00825 [Nitrospiraceae bacterium]
MIDYTNELSNNIVDSIIESSSVELTAEITEFSIDKLLDDSLFKEIPWVGWIFKAKNIYTTLSDRILLSKIIRFLISLDDIPEEKKKEFRTKLESDKKFKERAGSTLFVLIDKLDDLEKPRMLSKIFSYYLKGYISFSDFHKLSDSVSLAFIGDLKDLVSMGSVNPTQKLDLESLYRSGLSQIQRHNYIETRIGHSELNIGFEVSSLGGLFVQILNDSLKEPKQ